MPNGGSDCCGTCWFNRRNQGERGYPEGRNRGVAPYCDIRDVAIRNPFWTYCANHPHRRPDRDPIPIGPITRHVGDSMKNDREVWRPSPDSEEVRLHLLALLENFVEHILEESLPDRTRCRGRWCCGSWGEFREERAEESIRWVSENIPEPWSEVAREALSKIGGRD